MRATATIAVLATAVPLGCAGDGPPAPTARFDAQAAEAGRIDAVPFPNDVFRDPDGALAFAPFPASWGAEAPLGALQRSLLRRDGFCTTCAVRFAIDGDLALDDLPSDVVILVDVDPASPERGRSVPVDVAWDAELGHVTARPARGVTLRPATRYAAALTSALLAADGRPVAASRDFLAIRDDAPDANRRLDALIEPALVDLTESGAARHEVIAVTTFTTARTTALLREAYALAHASPMPRARVERIVRAGAELEALLGTPSEDRPGVEVAPTTGTDGDRAIRHATTAFVITGSFEAPRVVTGRGEEVGRVRLDGAGRLEAVGEPVPFVLIVPESTDYSTLPVVLTPHGFNSSRVLGFVYADTAGGAGAAVLAIDAYQHGRRAASATDTTNAMRGIDGADGFAETSPVDVSARTFGASGVAPGTELDPDYALGAFLQFATDAMSAVRLLAQGDVSEVRAAAPELAALAFDPRRIFVSGNSLGAVVSTSLLAVDPIPAAFVLDVMPGSIVDNLVDSPEFRPLIESVFLPVLGVPRPAEPGSLGVHPVVDLFRWALEPVDPLALARHVLVEPVLADPRPDLLVQLAELDEVASPAAGEAFVVAAGIPAAQPLSYANASTVMLPAEANVDTATGAVTAVAVRFAAAGHGMLEVRDQVSRYEAPVLPPFTTRAEPLPLENPIEAVHAQIEALLRSRIDGGRARVQ